MKKIFAEQFPLPKERPTGQILAEPLTKRYPLIGISFDYLLRWHIEHLAPVARARTWVARNAVIDMMAFNGGLRSWMGEEEIYEMTLDEFVTVEGDDPTGERTLDHSIISDAKKHLDDALARHKKYIMDGKLGDDLIESAIRMGQLDPYSRAVIYKPDDVDPADIKDMRNLINVATDSNHFNDKSEYSLNPAFGAASDLVGGADADIIMDDTLIDIKTTKNLRFTQDYYNQLIGYYMLNVLSPDPTPINKVAIYYSRHGILHTIDVGAFEDRIEKFSPWFAKVADLSFKPPEISFKKI